MVCLTAKRGCEAKNLTTSNAFRADSSGCLTSMPKKIQDIHLILAAFGLAPNAARFSTRCVYRRTTLRVVISRTVVLSSHDSPSRDFSTRRYALHFQFRQFFCNAKDENGVNCWLSQTKSRKRGSLRIANKSQAPMFTIDDLCTSD